ncbi:ArsR family transcriptional regulator [Peribacillus cavernae]|uniref:ArsR family transcriptional regulator n=1 Tax=Peribacillus cavernae TaxID=1674310 RepID=A0A3S0U0A8_9BACI|nr:metalloregulator ArsR/SmtB family transcription factor [Peribacillus cavernae]MDQ0218377.1 ArsR family transcriptional regulator [Peribacillus cavernae]RUQ31386.1 ArsR family transcriptional regulator [Peribacillus cavernae]
METKQDIDVETAASILKLLGDKTRLTMVKIMAEHECCVCEFVALFEMSQPAISQHLRKLKDSGIVKESRKGQWIFYSLNPMHPYYSFVTTIISELPSQQYKLEELEVQGKRISCD